MQKSIVNKYILIKIRDKTADSDEAETDNTFIVNNILYSYKILV